MREIYPKLMKVNVLTGGQTEDLNTLHVVLGIFA
jgi:hypothetical protein